MTQSFYRSNTRMRTLHVYTRYGYNKALSVNFMANYQEEMAGEPIEANSQHLLRIAGQHSPRTRFLRAEFAHSAIT